MRKARAAGAHALVLRDIPLDGPAMAAFTRALGNDGLRPHVLHRQPRAWLDATRDADTVLRERLTRRSSRSCAASATARRPWRTGVRGGHHSG